MLLRSLAAIRQQLTMEWVALLLFLSVILVSAGGLSGCFTLGGTALIFAGIGVITGEFNEALLSGCPTASSAS